MSLRAIILLCSFISVYPPLWAMDVTISPQGSLDDTEIEAKVTDNLNVQLNNESIIQLPKAAIALLKDAIPASFNTPEISSNNYSFPHDAGTVTPLFFKDIAPHYLNKDFCSLYKVLKTLKPSELKELCIFIHKYNGPQDLIDLILEMYNTKIDSKENLIAYYEHHVLPFKHPAPNIPELFDSIDGLCGFSMINILQRIYQGYKDLDMADLQIRARREPPSRMNWYECYVPKITATKPYNNPSLDTIKHHKQLLRHNWNKIWPKLKKSYVLAGLQRDQSPRWKMLERKMQFMEHIDSVEEIKMLRLLLFEVTLLWLIVDPIYRDIDLMETYYCDYSIQILFQKLYRNFFQTWTIDVMMLQDTFLDIKENWPSNKPLSEKELVLERYKLFYSIYFSKDNTKRLTNDLVYLYNNNEERSRIALYPEPIIFFPEKCLPEKKLATDKKKESTPLSKKLKAPFQFTIPNIFLCCGGTLISAYLFYKYTKYLRSR